MKKMTINKRMTASWQTLFVVLIAIIVVLWVVGKWEELKRQHAKYEQVICDVREYRKEEEKKDVPKDNLEKIPSKPKEELMCDMIQHGKESKSQKEVCGLFEQKLGVKLLRNQRPKFLENPEKPGARHRMELDCYSPDLGFAIEYNGEQHYVYPHVFHKNEESFLESIRRDQFKVRKCKQMGVYLAVIPYNIKGANLHKLVDEHIAKWRQTKADRLSCDARGA